MTTECCRQRWLLSARQVQSKFFRLAGARRSDKVERNLAVTIDVKARDDRRCVVLALIVAVVSKKPLSASALCES